MNEFDDIILSIKEYQPDLSLCPLKNEEKHALFLKIKNMHCQGCTRKGLKPYIPLVEHDFEDACKTSKVCISTFYGDSITEVFENLNMENINIYSDLILNFIFKKGPTADCMNLISEKLQQLTGVTFNWGLCVGENAPANICIELIAYCKA